MKSIRNITTLLGLSLVFFALAATRANAQALTTASFRGTFTLPFEAQWGEMTLPAGDYSLDYGLLGGSTYMVEVIGKEKANPHGLILARAANQVPTSEESALICIREGDRSFVRELRMGAIGGSVSFTLPHGVEVETKLITKHRDKSGNTQLAERRMLIQRVPVIPGGK